MLEESPDKRQHQQQPQHQKIHHQQQDQGGLDDLKCPAGFSENMISALSIDEETELHECLQVGKQRLLEERHLFACGLLTPSQPMVSPWRMKLRMRTVSVGLLACLNIGVEPPDVVKTQPCASLECWIDPHSLPPQKALATIGNRLQLQYERWQPRARYVQSLDQTVDDVRKLCMSLRRSSRSERVLLHYNGHGVPKPTENGEIWVFNKNYTQYIPLSIYDLQSWMGTPSIYVFDCSNAGVIVKTFMQFASQRDQESLQPDHSLGSSFEVDRNNFEISRAPHSGAKAEFSFSESSILLAACSANELLPMNPNLPADIFTSCLTTPIKMALRWFAMSSVLSSVSPEMVFKIPGRPNDRRTPLGELNWIFTAITDTIAWNVLSQELFQRLFRQDLLVASLFRNFLLSERILRSVNCTPISVPELPSTRHHEMWKAWDLAAEFALSQLEIFLKDPTYEFQTTSFFAEQLTAFEVWLELGSEDQRNKPLQLPIVLQVLLSQAHRLRALQLLARFLDKGPWAVNLSLSVGIFPYVLKLLQSPTLELRNVLVFIWAKILALDQSCQAELVKDMYHSYFIKHMSNPSISSMQVLLCTFVLTLMCHNNILAQNSLLRSNELLHLVWSNLSHESFRVRQWSAILFARLWHHNDDAKSMIFSKMNVIPVLLDNAIGDQVPEVRAASVYALGSFFGCPKLVEQELVLAKRITPLAYDASPLVRIEVVLALSNLILAQKAAFLRLGFPFDSHARVDDDCGVDETVPNLRNFVWKVIRTLVSDPFEAVSSAAAALSKRMSPAYSYQRVLDECARDEQVAESSDPSASARVNPETQSDEHEEFVSEFFRWSLGLFRRSLHGIDDADAIICEEEEDVAEIANRDWRQQRNFSIHRDAESNLEKASSVRLKRPSLLSKQSSSRDLAHQIAILQSPFEQTSSLVFHPFEPMLVGSDALNVGVWNFSTGEQVNVFANENHNGSHITALTFINEQYVSLLATASDDGVVRVWKDIHSTGNQRLVTCWNATSSMKRRAPGLVIEWQQLKARMITSGNAPIARVWDVDSEVCIADIDAGADTCISCMASDNQGDVLYFGCLDHSVRRVDLRAPTHNCSVVHTHDGFVVNVHKQKKSTSSLMMSGSIRGDIRLWDPRSPQRPHKSFRCLSNPTHPMNAAVMHDHANMLAVGSSKQFVKVFDTDATVLNTIRYHDGFLGQRIGPLNCLAFHPHRLLLACGCRDRYISIIADREM